MSDGLLKAITANAKHGGDAGENQNQNENWFKTRSYTPLTTLSGGVILWAIVGGSGKGSVSRDGGVWHP